MSASAPESRESAAPATAAALFDSENLPVPPVPAHLAAALRPQGRTWFATRAPQASPYELAHFLKELDIDPQLPEYAVVGFDGYGTNSWAAHHYLVSHGIALFIQLPWGGAFVDPEPARADIADLFAWAARLQSKVELAHAQQKIPAGWRLQVVATRFGRAGWRWLVAGRDNATAPWNPPAGMKAVLQRLLDDILNGAQVL
jgi:hypothetical protein